MTSEVGAPRARGASLGRHDGARSPRGPRGPAPARLAPPPSPEPARPRARGRRLGAPPELRRDGPRAPERGDGPPPRRPARRAPARAQRAAARGGLRAGLRRALPRRARDGAGARGDRPRARRPRAAPGASSSTASGSSSPPTAGSAMLLDGVAPHLLEPPVNVLRVGLHPEGLAARIAQPRPVARPPARAPRAPGRPHRRRRAAHAARRARGLSRAATAPEARPGTRSRCRCACARPTASWPSSARSRRSARPWTSRWPSCPSSRSSRPTPGPPRHAGPRRRGRLTPRLPRRESTGLRAAGTVGRHVHRHRIPTPRRPSRAAGPRHRDPAPLGGAARRPRRDGDGHPRLLHRQRRHARDAGRPARGRRRGRMGRRGLRPGDGAGPHHRRPPRRPARPPADVRLGPRAVHPDLRWPAASPRTPATLVAARVAQGAASALLMPQVLAILGVAYEGADRVRAFTAYALTLGVAAVAGQLVGGALIAVDPAGLGWRSCFLVNVPVGVARARRHAAHRPRVARRGRHAARPAGRGADHGGARRRRAAAHRGPRARLAGVDVGVARGGPGAPRRLRAHPAAPGRARRQPDRPARALGRSPASPPRSSPWSRSTRPSPRRSWCWPSTSRAAAGSARSTAGLLFSVLGAGFLVTSSVAGAGGPAIQRLGRQVLAVGAGVRVLALGGLWLVVGHVGAGGSVAWLAVPLFLDGAGMGLVMGPLLTLVLAGVRPEHAGAASGVPGRRAAGRQRGRASPPSASSSTARCTRGLGAAAVPPAYRAGLLALAALGAVVVALVQRLPRERRHGGRGGASRAARRGGPRCAPSARGPSRAR